MFFSRRGALGLLGTGPATGGTLAGSASAGSHNALVESDGGEGFHATNGGGSDGSGWW